MKVTESITVKCTDANSRNWNGAFLEVGFCALDPKMQLAISQRDYADLMNTLACSKTESITRDLRF